MTSPNQCQPCACGPGPTPAKGKVMALKVMPSASLSLLIAFFPKCPVCWAVYMSMFSSIGLANLPYMEWLFPVLLCFLGLHLLMLLRRVPRIGWLPFALSLTGAMVIVWNRTAAQSAAWMLVTGMALIVSGSILNGLAHLRRS